MKYPVVEETQRPYRLWDANAKCSMRWRYYAKPQSAHMGALIEARWAKVGTVIEVYNTLNGRLLGQYTRRPTSIDFQGE